MHFYVKRLNKHVMGYWHFDDQLKHVTFGAIFNKKDFLLYNGYKYTRPCIAYIYYQLYISIYLVSVMFKKYHLITCIVVLHIKNFAFWLLTMWDFNIYYAELAFLRKIEFFQIHQISLNFLSGSITKVKA